MLALALWLARGSALERDGGVTLLAFGDSLTRGYTLESGAIVYTPYADALAAALGGSVRVECAGVVGEQTPAMLVRLQHYLEAHTPTMYRLVLLLGGTNDLGAGLGTSDQPARTAENLRRMAALVLSRQRAADVLLMTMPDCQWPRVPADVNAQIDARRRATNALIRDVGAQLGRATGRVRVFELDAEFGVADTVDGVHFRAAVYARWGQRLAEVYCEHAPHADAPAGCAR